MSVGFFNQQAFFLIRGLYLRIEKKYPVHITYILDIK